MLTHTEALHAVLSAAIPGPVETRSMDLAAGAVLREDLLADRDQPPFDRATMDGIAFSRTAWEAGVRRLTIEGIQPAGAPALRLSEPAAGCFRIMTGAVLPAGCDGVLESEQVLFEETVAQIADTAVWQPHRNVHGQGSDKKAGHVLLAGGCVLTPQRLAIAISAGAASVCVSQPLRAMVVSTGNELADLGEALAPYQIRPSNAYGLVAALRDYGCRAARKHVPDDLEAMRELFSASVTEVDLILVSGGVSKGLYDFVPRALEEAGVEKIFHRVAQKPGKPLWFGQHPQGATVFGLPGNPVSTLIGFREYVVPWLRRSLGLPDALTEWVTLNDLPASVAPLTGYFPVRKAPDMNHPCAVDLVAYQGSGHLAALAESDGYVVIDPEVVPNLTTAIPVPFRGWGAI